MKILIALIVLSITQAAFAAQSEITQLRICFSRWWPYNFTEAGEVKGMQVDILKSAFKNTDVALTFTELPFKRCKDYVKLGKYDFILDIDESDNLNMINYSLSSWQLAFAVAQNQQLKSIKDTQNLQEFRVILAQEYDYPDDVYEKLTQLNADIVRRSYYEASDEDAKALFSILKTSHVEALLVDRYWAKQIVSRFKLPVYVFDEPLHIEPQYIGYNAQHSADKALLLEKQLHALSTQQLSQIRNRYR
ncbi:transporter substrate-binding domain-containing protein [Pseudoalteromonas sp. MMG022]|uniref:transporter substrate-binding domain-containing protein n=1 Tax=Pseudoalteromonas sp. MMG022 TaxID=2909978 RepID=UPI001F3FB73C|nr:transporter substrate-binding domain-containing protein [Pseudoalteromonas sp. MMG022]MCF6434015.1 transporter substrate-binding domain-containing protein [Pseudoalteromonas sp. MMG022]